MKILGVEKLFLYPRFQMTVAEALNRVQPEVIELSQPLSEHMKTIQSSILVAMKTCVSELKKAVPQLDTSFLSLENSLFRNFDMSVRLQLDPEWHRLSARTKQLVTDMGELRKLLEYLLRYDAYTFYSFLLSLRSANAMQSFPSLWYCACVCVMYISSMCIVHI
jgi:DNA excision repair protein ERCC-4